MKYSELSESGRSDLEQVNLYKLAMDVAKILDGPDFTGFAGEKAGDYEKRRAADERIKFFDLFCAVFTKAGLPLPPFEPIFVEEFQDEPSEKIRTVMERLTTEIDKLAPKARKLDEVLIAGIAGLFASFPHLCSDYGSVSGADLLRLVNRLLILNDLKPIRPDYSDWKPGPALAMSNTSQPVRVLIFDDDRTEIARTLVGLVGWPGLDLVSLQYRPGVGSRRGDVDAKVAAMQKAAESVIALDPDVVLMDQGLVDFEGSQLIPVIRQIATKEIIFVANTGGEDVDLRRAGAYPNCGKGQKLDGLRGALHSIRTAAQLSAL
ncbi:MAG: hypothetical protein WC250_01140 [Candidatus Paceibacterota bacterium]|jgi:hypothetical protein